jgi:hypothetical protein
MVFKNSMLRDFLDKFTRSAPGLAAIVIMCLLMACSPPAELTEEQRSALEQRVEQRWRALVARDFASAWEYTTPAYRGIFPKQLYVRKFSYATEWELTGLEVVNYDGAAAVASVVVRVMSKPTKQTSSASIAIGARPRSLRERWILEDGEWWFSANY